MYDKPPKDFNSKTFKDSFQEIITEQQSATNLIAKHARLAGRSVEKYLEAFTSAYYDKTSLDPEDAVMCHTVEDGIHKVWFEKKEDRK